MIELQHIVKYYRTDEVETTALQGLDLSIQEGEFVSIMGESGCGKSTLLNIIGMLDTASEGIYTFNDQITNGLNERERSRLRKNNIGFIFQSFNLIDELSVFENVELPLVYLNVSKAERKTRVDDVLKRMGIAHRAKHYPQQLSGGQQQRVAIARAVITSPKLLLADEPTGNLDSHHGNEVMELITQLNQEGTTVVMVTHSEHDATFSKRIVRLVDGKVVSQTQQSKSQAF